MHSANINMFLWQSFAQRRFLKNYLDSNNIIYTRNIRNYKILFVCNVPYVFINATQIAQK